MKLFKMILLYLKIIISIVISIITYGFICPYLISAQNSIKVIIGIILVVLVPVILLVLYWNNIVYLINKLKEKK